MGAIMVFIIFKCFSEGSVFLAFGSLPTVPFSLVTEVGILRGFCSGFSAWVEASEENSLGLWLPHSSLQGLLAAFHLRGMYGTVCRLLTSKRTPFLK